MTCQLFINFNILTRNHHSAVCEPSYVCSALVAWAGNVITRRKARRVYLVLYLVTRRSL